MEFHRGQWQVQSISFVKTLRWSSPDFQVQHHLYADDMQLLAKTLPQHSDSCLQELGWSKVVKEEFLAMLREVVFGIDSNERLLI